MGQTDKFTTFTITFFFDEVQLSEILFGISRIASSLKDNFVQLVI